MAELIEPRLIDDREERLFRRMATISVVGFLVAAWLIWTVDVLDTPGRKATTPLPARVVEIQLEEVPAIDETPAQEEEPPADEEPEPEAEAPPPDARDEALNAGLLAMNRELGALTALASNDTLADSGAGDAEFGTDAHEPDILASAVTTDSGGIDTRGLGANAGGGGPTRSTRQVHASQPRDLEREVASRERTTQMIQQVFDQNKSRIHTLYERARRQKPGLQGKLVLEITIQPSGQVSQVRIVSSDLNYPSLEKRVVARVKQFVFPPSQQGAITRTYPIEFLPS